MKIERMEEEIEQNEGRIQNLTEIIQSKEQEIVKINGKTGLE